MEKIKLIRSKKAVSEVIATVLIILVVITAIAIITPILINFTKNKLTQGQACFDMLGKLSFDDAGYACSNSTGTFVTINVGDIEIDEIKAVVYKSGSSTPLVIKNNSAADVEMFGGGTTTVLNNPTSSMLSQSGLGGWVPTQLVDGVITSEGFQTSSSGVGSWLKIDLGAGNEKSYIQADIYIYNGEAVAVWDIQYSDDGSAWSTAAIGFDVSGGTGWKTKTWGSAGSHRYWRFYKTDAATSAVGYHRELKMYEGQTIISNIQLPPNGGSRTYVLKCSGCINAESASLIARANGRDCDQATDTIELSQIC